MNGGAMKYVSTRGRAPVLEFADVLLTGLANDGGLYVPETWPALDAAAIDGRPYADAAVEVMWPYVDGTIDRAVFASIVHESYATFDHPDVCPVVELEAGLWLLELFHGPTLAFKDVALQLVGRLFDHELTRRDERATIVVATSGDTGSAAIEACVGRDRLDIVVMHPAGRVSEVQRRQMTTVDAPNVHNVAVEGTFDDCQDLLKAMFADQQFRDRVRLSAMNSINFSRVLAQIVYYATSASKVGGGAPVAFSVPSGNFGNVLAGWSARRMGVPIAELIVASNRNDILTRWLETGALEMHEVVPTISPSMDIQVSSNLERLLFELHDRDGEAVAELMDVFRNDGRAEVDPTRLATLTETIAGARLDDEQTMDVIADVLERTGRLIDPHTAVGVGAARAVRRDPSVPMICVATAHPAKFPDAVEAATGRRPELPPRLADLLERPERCTTLPNELGAVEAHIVGLVG
jgi:threonine synthase